METKEAEYDEAIKLLQAEILALPDDEEPEDKNEKNQEAIKLLLEDPELIHFVWGIYNGLAVQKAIRGGKDIPQYDLTDLQLNNFPELRISEKKDELFAERKGWKAVPAVLDFKGKKALGIVFESPDNFSRKGYSSFWVLVPEEKKDVQDYITQNPEILLEIFKQKFKEFDKSKGKLLLANKDFIKL